MNTASPLAELRDLQIPEPVSWWPPAIGWWFIAGMVLCLFLTLVFFLRRYNASAMKRSALKELENIRSHHQQTGNRLQAVRELSILLRRVCISIQPRKQVAALTGDDWLDHLDQLGRCDDFSTGIGRQLATAPYRQECESDILGLFALCESWLNKLPRKLDRREQTE